MSMTKKRALEIVRRARYGWYNLGPAPVAGRLVAQCCPQCSQRISTVVYSWATSQEMYRAARDAVIEHLTTECQGES